MRKLKKPSADEILALLEKHFPQASLPRRRTLSEQVADPERDGSLSELAHSLARAADDAPLTGYWGERSDGKALDARDNALRKARLHAGQLSDHGQRMLEIGARVERESGSQTYILDISPDQMLEALLAGVRRARQSNEMGDKTRANIRATTIAYGCGRVWKSITNEDAPRPDPLWRSHKEFHRFARDVLDAFGEDAEVPSAQGAWEKRVRNSGENSA